MDFKKLENIFNNGTADELNQFCNDNDLEIKNGKIFHKSPSIVNSNIEFWDKRQLVKKINLNS